MMKTQTVCYPYSLESKFLPTRVASTHWVDGLLQKSNVEFEKLIMTDTLVSQKIVHPMEKFQGKVQSLVSSRLIQTTDRLWKIAFLFGDEWHYWKKELEEFEFTMQDTIGELLAVESWEEEPE